MAKTLDKWFGGGKTVDGILSTFTQVIQDLKDLQESKKKEVDEINNTIFNLEQKQRIAEKESTRAEVVLKKLEDLVS